MTIPLSSAAGQRRDMETDAVSSSVDRIGRGSAPKGCTTVCLLFAL